jgi:branched-chain amino acid transport system substrate-binding protein
MRTGRSRCVAMLAALALTASACGGDDDSPAGGESGKPIRVGSTLSLSGVFGPTAAIHRVAGKQFVERLNRNGGLLGRRVEWRVLDDKSDAARVSALYERLITAEDVDLIMGPYATPNIVAAMSVAERQSFTMPQHSGVLTYALTYPCQFPAWSLGPNPSVDVPNMVFDLLESQGSPPKRIAFVTNQAGSTDFITHGQPDADAGNAIQVARERGLEVVLDVSFPPDTTDWGPTAAKIRDADPDFLWISGVALDSTNLIEAMKQLRYDPPQIFDLFPSPGPLLGLGEDTEGMLAVSLFEPNKPTLDRLGGKASEIAESFSAAAKGAGLRYSVFETQAAASWTAWEILVQGVEGAGSTEQQAICDHLSENGADTTLFGHIDFDSEANNFYANQGGLKQIQDGDWVTVWPTENAAAEYMPAK